MVDLGGDVAAAGSERARGFLGSDRGEGFEEGIALVEEEAMDVLERFLQAVLEEERKISTGIALVVVAMFPPGIRPVRSDRSCHTIARSADR